MKYESVKKIKTITIVVTMTVVAMIVGIAVPVGVNAQFPIFPSVYVVPTYKISGQMSQPGGQWGKIVKDGVVTGYETTSLQFFKFFDPLYTQFISGSDKGYQITSNIGGTVQITGLTLNEKQQMSGVAKFYNGKVEDGKPGGKYQVTIKFEETRRTPDYPGANTGKLRFRGEWKYVVNTGTGYFEKAPSGNGSWSGVASYEGKSLGPVDSFKFLDATPEAQYDRVLFSGSIHLYDPVTAPKPATN